MKTLHLVRHAKSSWKDASLADRDRPLKKRGRHDARIMAEYMRRAGFRCDSVFSSPAARAVQTLETMRKRLALDAMQTHLDEALYTFDCNELLKWLRRQSAGSLMIVGHNPALLDLTIWLNGESIEKLPTAAWCWLTLAVENWSDISRGCGRIELLVAPGELR